MRPLRVSVPTAGEAADKHRSVWLDSSGLHSSWALTLRSRCDPYVCWFYYEPSGNQWPETHLGAHPLVISLISLLALAIWVLSPGQWLSARRDWSGSSYRSLINGCGWGDGSFLFPSLFFSFSPLFAGLWYRGVMYVMFPWGGPDDWHEPPGRPADWLAGRSSPTRGFDMDDAQTHTHTHTHTHLFPPPHTFFPLFLCAECISRCHTDGLCTTSMKTQPINDIRRSLFPPGRSCWSVIGTC